MSTFRYPIRRPAIVARGRRGTRGQGLVEFALVLPVFLVLLLALFDTGRVLYAQNTITQAVSRCRAPRRRLAELHAVEIRQHQEQGVELGCRRVDHRHECHGKGRRSLPDHGHDLAQPGTDAVTAGSWVVVSVSVTVPLITPLVANILGGSITVSAR